VEYMITKIDRETLIFLFLSDEKGYANWRLAELLKQQPANLSKLLGKLESEAVIFRESRSTTNPESSHPNQLETAYYLHKDIAIFKRILQKLTSNIETAPRALDPRNMNKILKRAFKRINLRTIMQFN
jgi:hypothetical protein